MKWTSWLLAPLALVAAAAPASATTMLQLDTEALTTRAERVVLGVVEAQAPRWSSDHQAIYTEVTVRVTKVYKGDVKPGDTLVVRREGGEIDGVGMRVFGAAHFAVGEEVLLFVERRGGVPYTVGMTQGKLQVVTGDDGVKRVAADLSGVHLVQSHGDAVRTLPPALRRLDEVEREIAKHVRSRPQ